MRASLVSVLLLSALVPLVPAVSAETFTVTASNFAWTPASLAIAPGDSVTFTNGGGSHNWELDGGGDSCSLPCTRTFNEPETIGYHCGIHPSMTGTIVVGVGPTIAITTPAGSTLTGLARVEGSVTDGSGAVEQVQVTLRTTTVTATLSGAGPTRTWSADVPTTNLANGGATLTATATDANGLTDAASIPVTISNAGIIDVRVVSVTTPTASLRSVPIDIHLRNDGNTPSGPFRLVAEYFYHDEWHLIGSADHAGLSLGAGSGTTITWAPLIPNVGKFTIRARADVDNALPDVDRSNNVLTGSAAWITSQVPGIVPTDP